ncbi:MAG: hypothetical protein LBF60_04225 [Treponema sp.]|nr:hypothetical protein [Treponema sp.]
MKKRGQLYRLDLRAIDAESGRIMGSRITENIRGDGAWAALLQTRAGLAFQGDALTERNKRKLYQGVRNAAWKYGVSIELRTYPTS